MPLPCLHILLDANLELPPEYREGLSNHLPMALQALQSMGASRSRLQAFNAHYRRHFDGPVPAVAPAFAALLARFDQALQQEGEVVVLRRELPGLLPGVAAAAFHGAIRTAHALQAGHRRELAAGLAYWAWHSQPLQAPAAASQLLAFDDWAQRLRQQAAGWRSSAPLISDRMADATQAPVYRALAGALAPTPDLLQRLAGLALETYLLSRNFTVLHMITGLRALRVLLPHAGELPDLQPLLQRVFTAAYLAANIKPLAAPPPKGDASWARLCETATRSNDDHTIKLVHACREEAAVYGEARYLEAAALALS